MTFVPRFLYLLRPTTVGDVIKFFFLGHFFVTHVGRLALTDGPSMLPTINVRGVRVYIDNSYRRGRDVKVGDVVDFHHPMERGRGAIKRVMGMPGDFVVKDGGEGRGKMMIQVRGLSLEHWQWLLRPRQEIADGIIRCLMVIAGS